jgi:hypothetical protein
VDDLVASWGVGSEALDVDRHLSFLSVGRLPPKGRKSLPGGSPEGHNDRVHPIARPGIAPARPSIGSQDKTVRLRRI